jgi:hypothetical protein
MTQWLHFATGRRIEPHKTCDDRRPQSDCRWTTIASESEAAMSKESAEQILEVARRAGFDLDLIDTNLALTPEQRWQQHDAAMDLALALEAGRNARDAGISQAAPSTD